MKMEDFDLDNFEETEVSLGQPVVSEQVIEKRTHSDLEESMKKFNMSQYVRESGNKDQSTYYYIKPYINEDNDNDIGLAKYDMSIRPETRQTEEMVCLERNGVVMYKNGLNEFDESIQSIENEEEKEAKILEIRETVAKLERMTGNHAVADVKSNDFWSSIKYINPFNVDTWEGRTLTVSNLVTVLNPSVKDDLITIKAIEGGGYSLVAPSLEVARISGGRYRFYLDKEEITASVSVSADTKFFEAGNILNKLLVENPTKMFYVLKLVTKIGNSEYKKTTSPQILFDALSKYIQGKGEEKKPAAVKNFLRVNGMSDADLEVGSYFKDAVRLHIIHFTDGHYVIRDNGTRIGSNEANAMSYLQSASNVDIYKSLKESVDRYW